MAKKKNTNKKSTSSKLKGDPISRFQRYWNNAKRDPLTKMSFTLLIENLRKYGNKPSAEQLIALLELMETYTGLIKGHSKGRFAFPLSCGLGKTQSLAALIKALSYMRMDLRPNNRLDDVSVTVCASKVEALCDIKRELMDSYVPEEEIGLLHSYKFDEDIAEEYMNGERSQLPEGYASLPSTDDSENRPFLLVTHNRVRGKSDVEMYNSYQGKPRDLLIWDESLFISDTRAINTKTFNGGLSWANEVYRDRDGNLTKPVIEYLLKCREITEAAEDKDRINFPPLSEAARGQYLKSLNGRRTVLEPLRDFLTISQNPVRVVKTGKAEGYLWFDIAVDSSIENIVVLDASHNIRELLKLDDTIKEAKFCKDLVSYENVKIRRMRHGSSRSHMEELFSGKKRGKPRDHQGDR